MYTDQRGLPLSAANEDAVRHFDETVSAYLAFSRDTGDHLKQALAADPELVMGYCLRGYFFKLFCHRKLEEKAKECHAKADAAACATGATEREFAHIEALAAWLRGDFRATVERWESILLDHPRDVLAIRLGHYLHFYLGDNENMRDSVARVLGEWDETVPNYGNLLGMNAFGVEEVGQYAEAEAAGRRDQSRRSVGGACRRPCHGDAGACARGTGVDHLRGRRLERLQQHALPRVVAPVLVSSRARAA